MRVITAPELYARQDGDIFCFLAGGITNCPDWQKEVIKHLEGYGINNLVLFNPRREDFPIHDKSASCAQIYWEYRFLQQMDIFSMYFCNGESDQPICMYELGRNLVRFVDRADRVVISVEDGYKRAGDVVIQSSLALGCNTVHLHATPEEHARLIREVSLNIMGTHKHP